MGKFLIYVLVVSIFSMGASWVRMFNADDTHGGSSWSSRTGGGGWGGGGGGHK